MKDLAELAPERPAAVARELTKVYEEVQRGSLAELVRLFDRRQIKGEICLVLRGRLPEEESLVATHGSPRRIRFRW